MRYQNWRSSQGQRQACISLLVIYRKWRDYNETLLGNHIWSIRWCQCQWSWVTMKVTSAVWNFPYFIPYKITHISRDMFSCSYMNLKVYIAYNIMATLKMNDFLMSEEVTDKLWMRYILARVQDRYTGSYCRPQIVSLSFQFTISLISIAVTNYLF